MTAEKIFDHKTNIHDLASSTRELVIEFCLCKEHTKHTTQRREDNHQKQSDRLNKRMHTIQSLHHTQPQQRTTREEQEQSKGKRTEHGRRKKVYGGTRPKPIC